MLVLRSLVFVAAILVSPFTVFGQAVPPKVGDLTIQIVHSEGEDQFPEKPPPWEGHLKIIHPTNGIAFDSDVVDRVTVRLPYGVYRAEFAGGVIWQVSAFTVNKPVSFAVLSVHRNSLVTDFTFPTSYQIKVNVRPYSTCREKWTLWAKLVGVYSGFSAESEIWR